MNRIAQLREFLDGHETSVLFVIACLAFAVRFAFSFFVFPILADPLNLGADPDLWGQLALNWVNKVGYALYSDGAPALHRGPGYPLLLAMVYVTTGALHPGIELVQSLIGALTCVIIYRLGRQVANQQVGYAAALMGTFYPLLVWYTPRLAYEPLHGLLLSLAILWSIRAQTTQTLTSAVVAGLFFGLTSLTNQVAMALILVVAAIYLVRAGSRWIVLRQIMVSVVAMGLIILPWTVRNYQLSGHIIPVHTGVVTSFVKGNFEHQHYPRDPFNMLRIQHIANAEMAHLLGLRNDVPVDQITGNASDPLMNEMAPGVEDALAPYAVMMIHDQPGKILLKALAQAPRFWYLSDGLMKSGALALLQGFLLLMAAIGAAQMVKARNRAGVVLIASILYYNMIYAFLRVEARYSTPTIPAALVLGAIGLLTAMAFFRHRLSNQHQARLASA